MDKEFKNRIIRIHESVARTEEKTSNIENKIDNLEKRLNNQEDEFQKEIEKVDKKAQKNRDYIKKAIGAVTVVASSIGIFGVYLLDNMW